MYVIRSHDVNRKLKNAMDEVTILSTKLNMELVSPKNNGNHQIV